METGAYTWPKPTKMPPAATSRSRKRKAADASLEERAQDKTRGRPRKSSHDASAGERRRTQIRLAQRAYRQRKETTIDELRERVAELTSTVEMMNRGLNDFAQSAVRRGLPTQTKVELDNLVRKYSPHFAAARNPVSGGQSQSDILRTISAVSLEPTQDETDRSGAAGKPSRIHLGMGYSIPIDENNDARGAANDATTFAATSGPVLSELPSNFNYLLPDTTRRVSPVGALVTMQDQYEKDLQANSTPSLDTPNFKSALVPRAPTVNPVMTYTYQEKSFARRLQRRSTEVAFHLLKDPQRAPRALDRIFTLQLNTGRDRDSVIRNLDRLVGRGSSQCLDSEISPFANIGGAGLHYPDTGSTRRVEFSATKAMDIMASRIPGLEGEWLDSVDVEGYLRELGIDIPGDSQYVTARIPSSKLVAPLAETDMDIHIASLSNSQEIADIETFHRLFLENRPTGNADDHPFQTPEPANQGSSSEKSRFAHLGAWNSSAVLADIDLGSLTNLMDSPALNFFSIPGTESYDGALTAPRPLAPNSVARPTRTPSPNDSSSASSTGGSTFSPPLSNVTDSASSEDDPTFVPPVLKAPGRAPDTVDRMITVTLDVERITKVLNMTGVCLGRAPGYRRRFVDLAVRNSVIYTEGGQGYNDMV